MKRNLPLLFSALLLALPIALSAAPDSSAGASSGPTKGDCGLLFNAKSILALDGFKDDYQAGAGIKYWVTPAIAARALLGVYHNTAKTSGDSNTILGFGLAGEWHPLRGAVSPYLGPLAGCRYDKPTTGDQAIDLYVGGLFGVEAKIVGPLSFFAEYDLMAIWDINGFTFKLGVDDSDNSEAVIGIIVYF